MKKCSICGEAKPKSCFGLKKMSTDGLEYECRECHNKRNRIYKNKNREVLREKNKKYKEKIYSIEPWKKHYFCIIGRCNGKHYYNRKGIRNHLLLDDIKMLWFRDAAWKLKKPSIDRIDPDGDYTIRNCQFIELHENILKRRNPK